LDNFAPTLPLFLPRGEEEWKTLRKKKKEKKKKKKKE